MHELAETLYDGPIRQRPTKRGADDLLPLDFDPGAGPPFFPLGMGGGDPPGSLLCPDVFPKYQPPVWGKHEIHEVLESHSQLVPGDSSEGQGQNSPLL